MERTRRSILSSCLATVLAAGLGAGGFGGEAATSGSAAPPAAAATPETKLTATDWKPIQDALGKPGALMPGGVYRVGIPRSDLEVTLDGIALQPGFALGGYAAFVRHGSQTLAVGDLVLLEDEVGGVATKLMQSGIEVTAVHNHLLRESPHVLYLHFLAQGDALEIARNLREALAGTATPLAPQGSAVAPAPAQAPGIDGATLDQILGRQGKVSGTIYQVSVGRAEPVTMDGIALPAATGVTTGLNFEATGDGQVAITGDFAMLPGEVQGVLGVLRSSGIEVTALHSHMLMDAPHLLYAHFWAHGDPATLARGLRAALGFRRRAGDHEAVARAG
jgi:hypothetical protein